MTELPGVPEPTATAALSKSRVVPVILFVVSLVFLAGGGLIWALRIDFPMTLMKGRMAERWPENMVVTAETVHHSQHLDLAEMDFTILYAAAWIALSVISGASVVVFYRKHPKTVLLLNLAVYVSLYLASLNRPALTEMYRRLG